MEKSIITETTLNDSFPLDQFVINGYSKPYRLDRTPKWGGVIIYIREDIPKRELKLFNMPENIKNAFL